MNRNDIIEYPFCRRAYTPILPLVYSDALSYLETLGQFAEKLNEVRKRVSDADRTQKEIEEQESNLIWMNGVITRVNNLINY